MNVQTGRKYIYSTHKGTKRAICILIAVRQCVVIMILHSQDLYLQHLLTMCIHNYSHLQFIMWNRLSGNEVNVVSLHQRMIIRQIIETGWRLWTSTCVLHKRDFLWLQNEYGDRPAAISCCHSNIAQAGNSRLSLLLHSYNMVMCDYGKGLLWHSLLYEVVCGIVVILMHFNVTAGMTWSS